MSEKTVSYEEYIEKNGSLTYTNVGVSMMPLLRQGKDLFTVTKRNGERCKKGDVVLYKRPPDQYVLHRIIEVRENDYVILGDNCVNKEYGIKDSDILGVMTGYIKNQKEHSISDNSYKLYSFIIMKTIGLRIFLKKTKIKVKKIFKSQKKSLQDKNIMI